MTTPQNPQPGTLDRIRDLAGPSLTKKTVSLLGSTQNEADAWLNSGRAGGLRTEAGLVHNAHLQQRLAQMRWGVTVAQQDPANAGDVAFQIQLNRRLAEIDQTQAAIKAKLSDARLSEEQRIADGYRLLNPLLDSQNTVKVYTTDLKIKRACSSYSIDNMVRMCGAKRGCVSSPPGVKAEPMLPEQARDINAYLKTDIDFVEYSKWEGGQHLHGYIPWYPGDVNNISGVTIGTGNDLGAASLADLERFSRLKQAPAGLIEKIRPYIGLKMQAACNKLSDMPLVVTPEEVKWLDLWRANYSFNSGVYNLGGKTFANKFDEVRQVQYPLEKQRYDEAVKKHKEWEDGPKKPPEPALPGTKPTLSLFRQLPQKEQTVLFSRLSHGMGGRAYGVGNIELLASRDWPAIWQFYKPSMMKNDGYKTRYNEEYKYFYEK